MTRLRRMIAICLALGLALSATPLVAQEEATPDSPQPAPEQESDALVYGEPIEGAIDNQTFTETWALQAEGADRIRVTVERLEGNLIPDVTLQDISGKNLNRASANNTLATAQIREYKLPAAGEYQIVVGRDRGETGETSGTYRLIVEALGLGADHPNNTAVVGPVEYDTPLSGEITAEHWQHVYTLNGAAGDLVQVTASRLSGTLLPRVELQDLNGQSLRAGNVDDRGVTARFDSYELRADGEYRVLVQRERTIDGDTVGEYELMVILLGSGENSARLVTPPTPVEAYDEALPGTITNVRWYEDWQLSASATDLITIVATRLPNADSTLKPAIILLGGAAQELRRGNTDSTGATATIERFKLPAAGSYTVRVLRDRGKAGTTSGQYELRVILEGSGVGSPALQPVNGAIQSRVPVEGEITNLRWADTWTYSGQAGEEVTITVTRTSGTLAPRIDIQDTNRQTLRSAQVAAVGDTATLQKYRLPTSAEYYIVVSRDRDQDGATSGTYSLVIQPGE